MKNTITLFVVMLICVFGNATTSKLKHLAEVNAEWRTQQFARDVVDNLDTRKISSFSDWIAAHLMLVETTLKARNVDHLSANQKSNRQYLLHQLNGYWKAGVFPNNDYLSYKNPIFIDRIGIHCAVGYLMQQSGNELLAQKIDASEKFAYINEIKTKGVAAWATENGFTIDELAWIQPGYPPNFILQELTGGFNGSVNAMAVNPADGTLYVAGSFTNATEGSQCNHIAVYLSGFAGWSWVGLGDGVNGNVHALMLHNNKLYVGGEFNTANGSAANHVAVFNLLTNDWETIGNLDGNVKALTIFNNELYAGGSFTGLVSKWDGTNWVTLNNAFLSGNEVRTLDVHNNQLFIGGDFELTTGAIRRNVAIFDGNQLGISGFGTPTPVNDFEVYNGKLYAACDFISATNDTCALAVFDEIEWKVIIGNNGIGNSWAMLTGDIKKLLVNGNEMLASGNFDCFVNMTYGKNLMAYKETAQDIIIKPLLVTDSTINCMTMLANSTLCFGGEFVGPQNSTLNHIASIDLVLGIENQHINGSKINAFPNPSSDLITLEADLNLGALSLYDMTGKLVWQTNVVGNSYQFSIKELNAGIYFLKTNQHSLKIVKS